MTPSQTNISILAAKPLQERPGMVLRELVHDLSVLPRIGEAVVVDDRCYVVAAIMHRKDRVEVIVNETISCSICGCNDGKQCSFAAKDETGQDVFAKCVWVSAAPPICSKCSATPPPQIVKAGMN